MYRLSKINMRIFKSPVAWAIYLICMLPVGYHFQMAMNDNLGFDPIGALESFLRYGAIGWFAIGLLLEPISRMTPANLMEFRSPLRWVAYSYLLMLIAVYLVLDRQLDLEIIWIDLEGIQFKNVLITLLILMIPAVLLSDNLITRAILRSRSREQSTPKLKP